MFGAIDDITTSNDDPAMLDNVKQLAQQPVSQVTPQTPQFMTSSAPQTNAVSQFTATTVSANPQQTPQFQTTDPAQNDVAYQDESSNLSEHQDNSAHGAGSYSPHAEPAQGFSSAPLPDEPISDDTSYSSNTTANSDEVTGAQDSSADEDEDTPIEASQMISGAAPDPDHLAGMKQQAIEHLEPLVDHLDQSPEENFKTTMMMIQANDNHTLLEKALEQAKEIKDDKARANAMLDIINEINYFSQISLDNSSAI